MAASFNQEEIKALRTQIDNEAVADFLVDFKQKFKSSSKAEVLFIATVLSRFRPLALRERLVAGRLSRHFDVLFHFQDKVQNPATGKAWSVDLTVEVSDHDGNRWYKLGLEYDGHDRHYLESGVKKQQQRDLVIVRDKGYFCLRINPEMAGNAGKRHELSRNIKSILVNQVAGIRSLCGQLSPDRVQKRRCPLCLGHCSLGDDFCPECGGTGSITGMLRIPEAQYDGLVFGCPSCPDKRRPYRLCCFCHGKGELTRDAALALHLQNR